MDTHHEDDRNRRREAAERLLAWGFSPPSIAKQLRCSASWVYTVRRERELANADFDEHCLTWTHFLHSVDS